jgi:hypothetical protein
MIRFYLPVKPKDGGPHFTLYADSDLPAIPSVDDPVVIDTNYGVTFYVHNVTFAPTCDPIVYINCRSWFPETSRDAEELEKIAVRKYGWRRIG